MKICFHSVSGAQGNTLCSLISPTIDLSAMPTQTWRESVSHSDLVIIDVTAANAPALYLLGLADALQKRAVLLAPVEHSLPKPFEDRPLLVHGWNFDFLKAELSKILAPAENISIPQDDSPAGKFQSFFGDLLKMHGYSRRDPVEFDGVMFTLREQEMDLPLVQEISRRAKSLNLRVRLL